MVTDFEAEMYFANIGGKLFGAGVVALLVAIGLFSDGRWGWGIIAVLVIIGLVVFACMIPSDADIDASFNELAQKRIQQSLEKLGLEEGDIIREPLTIIGVGNYDKAKEGSDGVWRFNPMVVEIIHFGKNQLLTNTVQLDLLHPRTYTGKTNEFFYKDISAVSIEDSNDDGVASKRFLIKVHGQVELNTGIQKTQESVAEDAVKAIRKTLREKKQD